MKGDGHIRCLDSQLIMALLMRKMNDETCWSEYDVGLSGDGGEVGGRRGLNGGSRG